MRNRPRDEYHGVMGEYTTPYTLHCSLVLSVGERRTDAKLRVLCM